MGGVAQSHAVVCHLRLECKRVRVLSLVHNWLGEMFTNTILTAVHIHSPEMYPLVSSFPFHSCYYHLVSLPAGERSREGAICQI